MLIAVVSPFTQTCLLISSRPMALPACSACLPGGGACSPVASPGAFYHMPCAFTNSTPSKCEQKARRALMKHRSCRGPQFSLGLLWDSGHGRQEVHRVVPSASLLTTQLLLQYHPCSTSKPLAISSQALSSHLPNQGTVQRLTLSWAAWRHWSSSSCGWVTNLQARWS